MADQKHKEHGSSEVDAVRNFIQEYGQPIAVGLVLAVVLVLGFTGYKQYKTSVRERASELLASAQSADQFQQIIQEYSGTPAAPIALQSLASRRFHGGQYEMARASYQEFLQNYPDHTMAPAAELGLVYCDEASGNLDAAQQGYTFFAQKYPEHFLHPLAVFGQARCLEQKGELEAAKAIYEDYRVSHPNTVWEAQVESALQYVNREMRKQADQ